MFIAIDIWTGDHDQARGHLIAELPPPPPPLHRGFIYQVHFSFLWWRQESLVSCAGAGLLAINHTEQSRQSWILHTRITLHHIITQHNRKAVPLRPFQPFILFIHIFQALFIYSYLFVFVWCMQARRISRQYYCHLSAILLNEMRIRSKYIPGEGKLLYKIKRFYI